jgi:chromosome segregation protein
MTSLREYEDCFESLQNKRKLMVEERNRLSEAAKELRETARVFEDNAYQEDIQRARSETKRAGLIAKLLEDYEISEEEAFRLFPSIQVATDAERLATKLRREIRSLGSVNIGAIEAYESLTERYETLVTQRSDILTSKEELDKSINELDKLTRGAFYETFNKVNNAFNEMFSRLFDGGHAKLVLTDPDNLLESGVEIEVQVPGKRTQRLELLSGGERALSACALLFALFKVKPSPLCILDELDAPLDGRNVVRYAELLKEFSQTSQFLVITHNEVTIEAASLWFGLSTQGEPGVSFVLPYRADVKAAVSMR